MKFYLFFLLLAARTVVAPVCNGQYVALTDCVQTFSADSVAVYYDQNYVLAARECASIKRVGRMNSAGKFYGIATDYRINDGSRLGQFTYEHGVLDGPATLYFSQGQPAAQGQVVQGRQNSDWQYWYPNGTPRQVLRFPTEGPVRIIAYWDSTGHQQVSNGAGTWQGVTTTGLLAQGNVELGLPSGNWEGYDPHSHQPVTTELYEKGTFRRGRLNQPQADQPADYRFGSQLTPQEPAPFLRAEYLKLGFPCAESYRQAQFQLIRTDFQLPSSRVGPIRYADRLAQRLSRYRATHWYASLPPQASVRCILDQNGRFVGFESKTSALREVVRRLVSVLPAWQPARYQNMPVPGYLDIVLDTSTGEVKVKAAARLLSSQLPEPKLIAWP